MNDYQREVECILQKNALYDTKARQHRYAYFRNEFPENLKLYDKLANKYEEAIYYNQRRLREICIEWEPAKDMSGREYIN